MDQYAVFSSFFFRAYSVLWRLARPWLRRRKRLAAGWAERSVPPNWCAPVDVWIQAASGGEARLALSLLEKMSARTSLKVLLTTWTTQGRAVLEEALPDLLLKQPWLELTIRFAPLDEPAVARQAMMQANPRLLVLLETELWPGLLGACAESGVPVHIFNARMSKTSFEFYRMISRVLQSLPVCRIHAISREDAARFERIFGRDTVVPCTIGVMPNIKFDRAAEALGESVPPILLRMFRRSGPVFLLASVRQQEETRLVPLLGQLLQSFSRPALVVAPRHMHRVEAWMARLYDMGFNPVASSTLKPGQAVPHDRVLVWDTFGDLPRLYAVADAVFVGGSLGLGGQNFLEAVAAGVVPCVGASLENFRWALGEDSPPALDEAGLLNICATSRVLVDRLRLAARNPADREDVQKRFRAWLAPRTGGAVFAAHRLDQALNGADEGAVKRNGSRAT